MSYSFKHLLIAVVLAFAAVLLSVTYIQGQTKKLRAGETSYTVMVAKKDIPQGATIKQLIEGEFIESKEIVKRDAAPGALTNVEDLGNATINTQVYVGQQLVVHMFKKQVSSQNISGNLKGNERAMMVPMGTWQGVGSYVQTGDRIDIFASRTEKDTPVTWVVARNIEVLKAPAKTEEEPKANGDPVPFLLRVTDKVAQDLIWAQSHADDNKLIFALRPENGDQDTRLDQPLTDMPRLS